MIGILMAVYNGQAYLSQQIESIMHQSNQSFHLLIADDGSTDESFSIAQDAAAQYPGRITVSRNPQPTGSAQGNFFAMLFAHKTEFDYFMFSDQDDVWRPDKIAVTLAAVQREEQEAGIETPILGFTDLTLVDRSLTITEPSLWKATGAGNEPLELRHAVLKNRCAGCTFLMNRALATSICAPSSASMHDWWIYLSALVLGRVVAVDVPTILYRQHGGNSLGSQNTKKFSFRLKRMLQGNDVRCQLQFTYQQAEALRKDYNGRLRASDDHFLLQYASLPQLGKMRRIRTLLQLGALKSDMPARIAQLLYC